MTRPQESNYLHLFQEHIVLAPARMFGKTRPHTPRGDSVLPSYATAQLCHAPIYRVMKRKRVGATNTTHSICNIPSVFAWMSNTLNGSCPSGNKLARITSRTSLGANAFSCWFNCDGEPAVVMAVMTLTSEILFSVTVGGVSTGVCVCVCTGDDCCCTLGSGCGAGCCGGVGRFG